MAINFVPAPVIAMLCVFAWLGTGLSEAASMKTRIIGLSDDLHLLVEQINSAL